MRVILFNNLNQTKIKTVLRTVVVMFVMILLLWQLDLWYQQRLIGELRGKIGTEIDVYENAMTIATNRRMAMLESLVAFVKVNATATGIGKDSNDFENAASGIYNSTVGIRTIEVIKGNQVIDTYPINRNRIGYRWNKTKTPELWADLQRAVSSKKIVLSGPYNQSNTSQPKEIRAWMGVYKKDGSSWGLVSIVYDLETILDEAWQEEEEEKEEERVPEYQLQLALRNRLNRVFYGDINIFKSHPVIYPIDLPDGSWDMAGVPQGGWQGAIKDHLLVFRIFYSIAFLFVAFLTYLIFNRQLTLESLVRQRTKAISVINENLRQEIAERQSFEKALRVSEERYRAIVEDQTELICRFLPDFTLTFVNQSYCRYLNKRREEIIGHSFLELISEADRPAIRAHFASLGPNNPVVTYEHQVKLPNGEIRWEQWVERAICDEKGGLNEYQSVGSDITERKRAEKILQIQRDLALDLSATSDISKAWRVILDMIMELGELDCGGVYLVDQTGGMNLICHRGCSDRHVERVKYYPANSPPVKLIMEGKPFYARPEQLPFANEEYLEESLRVTAAIPVVNKGRVIAALLLGSHLYSELSTDTCNALETIVSQTGSIIAKLQAEENSSQSEEKFKNLVENLNEVFFTLDTQGQITYISPAIHRLIGYTQEEVIGHHFEKRVEPEDCPGLINSINRTLAGKVATYEFRVRDKDNRIHFVMASFNPIVENGSSAGLSGLISDITERKQAEEAIKVLNEQLEQRVKERTARLEAINQELEAFSYSVSHDLRAPLRGIDGFSQLLLDEYANLLDDQGQDYLTRIRAATQRMAQLIDDLLKLSRITRGELHLEHLDLSLMAESIAAEMHKGEPQREVDWRISPGLTVKADAALMRIALVNLMDNAWKFTNKHQKARIEFGRLPEHNEVYFLRDDGAGFDMRFAAKLFTAFQRQHKADEFEGTGIGLAIVQRIINRHGGRIWAEAEVEKGATFYFTLS